MLHPSPELLRPFTVFDVVDPDELGNASCVSQQPRLHRTLEALLAETCPDYPVFTPGVDWADPALAPIARLAR